jgi:hypothetical protein
VEHIRLLLNCRGFSLSAAPVASKRGSGMDYTFLIQSKTCKGILHLAYGQIRFQKNMCVNPKSLFLIAGQSFARKPLRPQKILG